MKIAVIGAGVAGLLAVKYAKNYSNVNVICYEKNSEIGGMWGYRDSNKITDHSVIYKNLVTNFPNQLNDFEDFPFPDLEVHNVFIFS